jgi:hypothetical protein
MITAKEARALADESEARISSVLEQIGIEIEKLAKRNVSHYDYTPRPSNGDPTGQDRYVLEDYREFDTPPFWEHLITRLTSPELGYKVGIARSDPYVPRAYENDENQRHFVTYSLRISW